VSSVPVEYPALATRYPGVGPRAAAAVVDSIVGFLVIGIPLLVAFGTKRTTHSDGATTTTYSTSDSRVLLLWLVLAVAYYTFFEVLWGATPGKFVLGLRVRAETGGPITLGSALTRNALRIVDAFPYFLPYLFGAVLIWTDGPAPGEAVPRRRRAGDRLARTVVTYR
jgi:uncharacterized RDD family membrane protein YckC